MAIMYSQPKLNKNKAIIVDLDSTLCNVDHRIHFIVNDKTPAQDRFGNSNWERFYAELINDTPNDWCVMLIKGMWKIGVKPVYLTGRPEKYRDLTLQWFNRFKDEPLTYSYVKNNLYMRHDDDFTKDCFMKKTLFKRLIEPNYDIVFCLDDRKQVIDMFRSIGAVCLDVAGNTH